MSECLSPYYIHNLEIKKQEDFSDEFISNGISIYEVIRVIEGVPLFLERHLQRLKRSAEITNLSLKFDEDEIKKSLKNLIDINKVNEGNIKLVFNNKEESNYTAYFIQHKYPSENDYEQGVPAILYHAERNNPNAKVVNSSFKSQVEKYIREKNVYEAVLVDKNGNITEGSKSNIFMVQNNKVLTAPLVDVLPGITRQVIVEICNDLQIEVVEKKINEDNITDIDALFLTGTSPKVLPINILDNFKYYSEKNNIVLTLMKAYNKIIEEYIKINKNY